METTNIYLIVILIVLFVLGVFVIPQWRFRRSIRQVLAIFRQYGATSAGKAQTLEDMHLRTQRTFLQSLMKGRDYKEYALTALYKAQIVAQTEDGKFYLVEDKLPAQYRQ